MRGDFLFTLTMMALEQIWLALVVLLCLGLAVLTLPFLLAFEISRSLTRSVDRLFKGIA